MPDPLPQGVDVSVEHCDGRRALPWLCVDAAASPEDRKVHVSSFAFLTFCIFMPHYEIGTHAFNMHLTMSNGFPDIAAIWKSSTAPQIERCEGESGT